MSKRHVHYPRGIGCSRACSSCDGAPDCPCVGCHCPPPDTAVRLTARQLAHESLPTCVRWFAGQSHTEHCDKLTAALEDRDRSHTDELQEAAKLLRRLEWSGKVRVRAANVAACPTCGALATHGEHGPACELAKGLTRYDEPTRKESR